MAKFCVRSEIAITAKKKKKEKKRKEKKTEEIEKVI